MSSFKKNFFQLFGISLLIYPLSLMNQLILSNLLGTSSELDSYWLAFAGVNFLCFFMQPVKEVFVNSYFSYKKIKKDTVLFFSQILNFWAIILTILTIAVFIGVDPLTDFLIGKADTQNRPLIRNLLLMMMPMVSLIFITEIFNGLLTAGGKAVFQSIGRLLMVLFSIAFLWCTASHIGVYSLVLSLYASLILLIVIQVIYLRKEKYSYKLLTKPSINKQFIISASSLFIAYFIGQIYVLYERGTFIQMQSGLISALQYGRSLNDIPQNLLVVVVATSLWPSFLNAVGEGNNESVFQMTANKLKLLSIILCFITFFTLLFSKDLVYLLYFRGAFKKESLDITAMGLQYIILSSMPAALGLVLGRAIYSYRKVSWMALVGVISSSCGIIVLALGRYFEAVEFALLHFFINSFVAFILTAMMFLKLTGKKFDFRYSLRITIWLLKLFAIFAVLYVVFPSKKFQPLPKFDVFLLLAKNTMIMSFCTVFLGVVLGVFPSDYITKVKKILSNCIGPNV